MSEGWAERFQQKLDAKQVQRKEARRDFNIYRDKVQALFERIQAKVRTIPVITVVRPVMARTDQFRADVHGEVDTIKSLTLKCDDRTVEFAPEGINFEFGKGRVRIRHRIKQFFDYLFLYLVVDEASPAPFPDNLIWVLNDRGEAQPTAEYQPFTDERIEAILEAAFIGS